MSSRSTVLSSTHNDNALFKEFYGSGNDQSLVNKETPLSSLLMKSKKVDFVGDQFVQPVRFGSAVGLGYRTQGQNLPSPVAALRAKAIFQAKRAYATAEFDREAMKASRNDKGAWARVTVDDVNAAEEGFSLHMIERALFGDGSGKLGEVTSLTGSGTTADPWVITMATNGTNAPKHKKKYYPVGAALDSYTSAGVYQLSMEVVSASSTTVTCTLLSTGTVAAPVAADLLYWKGNRNGECVGLKQLAPSAASTLYGLSQSTYPNFMGTVTSITGTLDYGDINGIVADLEEEIGSPKIAITSHKALKILKNQSEDQKRYNIAEVKSSNGKIGFKGIEFMTDAGSAPMIASQMCPDDEIWFIDPDNHLLVMREDFGWFDDDGSILMRDPNKDVYNARYGGYFEHFCSKPNSVGRVKGFTVT